MDSILGSVKKSLGLEPTYDAFDTEIIMHINSVLSNLWQLGVGPETGFSIEDDSATWEQFLEQDNRYNVVKTYIYLRVRLLFDTPSASTAVAAIQEQIKEQEWRINVTQETLVPPSIPSS